MGGYAPTPADEPRPATLQQADQGNTIGNANKKSSGQAYWEQSSTGQQQEVPQQQQTQNRPGFPAGYVGGVLNPDGSVTGGHPAEASMEADRQRAGMYTYNAAQFRLMSNIEKYRVEARPDYVPLTQLGNSDTQRQFRETANTLSSNEQFASMGIILENQRQAAYKTKGDADDRYFENEMQKWADNAAAQSSAQHHLLVNSDIVGSNELAFRGDLAVEFLKGRPTKSSEWFSPVSGQMSAYLPGGRGVQQYLWDRALSTARGTGNTEPVSFMGAVERLGSARGTLFNPTYEGKAINASIEAVGEANAKRPFTSILSGGSVKSEIIAPTGEIDIFGFKATIPFLANFQQPITKTTITGAPRERMAMGAIMAGRDDFSFKMATNMDTFGSSPWVKSKGEVAVGAAMLGVPFAVGSPIITTRLNPATGETETITEQAYEQTVTQKFEQWDMSKQTVTPITTTFTPGMSAFQNFNKDVSDKYIKPFTPTPEKATRSGYAFLRVGKIVEGKGRVISPADIASFEKNSPMAAAGVKYFTEGWYAGLRDEPVTFGISYAAMYATGGLFRGAGMLTPTIGGVAGPTAAKTLTFMGGKVLPAGMMGIYGFDVTSRTTEGFTNYNPTSMAIKSGRITSTEIMPGFAGFNAGGRFVSSGASTGKAVYEDYRALQTIAKGQNLADIPTYGRPGIGEIKYTPRDYGLYKLQKFSMETQGRAAIFGENVMNTYVEAKVLTKPRVQVAATNTLSEMYGKYYQARGFGEYSPQTSKPSPFVKKSPTPEPFTSSQKLSPVVRMGTKTVGGSKVSGLRPEPSMKSMGIKEQSSGLGGTGKPFFEGRATDYRNTPRGAMKPMTKLQSAMLYPQEQMPQIASPKVKTGLVGDIAVMQDIQPSFIGQSPQKMGLMSVSDVMQRSFGLSLVSAAAQRQQFGQIQKDLSDTMVISAQKSRQFQEQMPDVFQANRQRYGLMSVQAFQSDMARSPDQTQQFVQNNIFKTDQRTRQAIIQSSLSSQMSSQKTDQLTRPRTDQITKPWTETTQRITETPRTPIIGFPPFGGGGGGSSFGMRMASPWSRKNLVGSELFMRKTKTKKGRSFRAPF